MKIKLALTFLYALTSFFSFAQLIDEEFEAPTNIPLTWIKSGVAISTNNSCAGSLQSVVFNGAGDALTTPLLVDPSDLKFLYLRSSNATAWTLIVEYSTSLTGTWTTIGMITDATNVDCLPFTYDLSALSNIFIRFRDARASGLNERYIDNVVVNQRPLAVSLTHFGVKGLENSAVLSWSTASESQNSHFVIEQSEDGKNFSAIGTVKGNGTTSTRQLYTFTDYLPSKTQNYYRLRQVDFDGKKTFSSIINFNFQAKKLKSKVFPTVVSDFVTIEFETEDDAQIDVRDIFGRLIFSQKAENTEGVNSFYLNLNNAQNGFYFISVLTSDKMETHKIQKL